MPVALRGQLAGMDNECIGTRVGINAVIEGRSRLPTPQVMLLYDGASLHVFSALEFVELVAVGV